MKQASKSIPGSITLAQLLAENAELRVQLDEALQTLQAIRCGEVDALVVQGAQGDHIFTLKGAETAYRTLIEEMNEGALTLSAEGLILYANRRFAELLKAPMEKVLGSSLELWVAPESLPVCQALLNRRAGKNPRAELFLTSLDREPIAVYLSASSPVIQGTQDFYYLVATDLTELNQRKKAEAKWQASAQYHRSLIEASLDPLILLGKDGKIRDANTAMVRMTGSDHARLLERDLADFFSDPQILVDACTQAFAKGFVSDFSLVMHHVSGATHNVLLNANRLQGAAGQTPGLVLTMRDITEFKRIEEALRQSELQYRDLFKNMLNGCAYCRMEYDEQGQPVDFVHLDTNLAFERLTGLKEVKGKPVSMVIPGILEESREFIENLGEVASTGIPKAFEMDLPLLNKSFALNVYSPTTGYFVATFDDITERKKAEKKLQLAASVFSHAREGIMITDECGIIIDVNEAFSLITSYGRLEVLGKNANMLGSGHQSKDFFALMWRELQEKGHWYGELWNRRKNGEVYAEMLNIGALRDAKGRITQYVGLFSDITALKDHEKELEHIAHYDALTDLPNRLLFSDRLQQAMVQAHRRQRRLAVAYLDLDGFKAINDHYGHEAGDLLLIALALRMKQALREGDTLSRIGGDEFVAILLDLDDIHACEPTLVRLLAAVAQPVQLNTMALKVSASLGVTFYPQEESVEADQLLRQADQAMYQAKLTGKNRFHVFDAEQDRSVRGHHESMDRIRRALNEREFVLYYQPKVNMRTGAVIGAEALIRWQHPENGLLLPAAFLPVIEDHPLSVELGEWVIDAALTQIEQWKKEGLAIPVSVNVGALQLQQVDFVERLRVMLAAHSDVRPGDLAMEVLETSALQNLVGVCHVIEECRKLGVLFALDDFGTGYSSLTYLKRLPVNQLKLDQSFVRDMLNDPDDLSILEGVLGLAIAFRREVIAEGVETVKHGAMLLQLGCDLAQGFGIARPMQAGEFSGWLKEWHTDPSWGDLHAVAQADLPLLFAGAELGAWVRSIEGYVKGERAVPPPLDQHQCRFGLWLDAVSLERQQSLPAIKAIKPLHQQIHELGAKLCELHAQGLKVDARLGELHELRDTLRVQLESL